MSVFRGWTRPGPMPPGGVEPEAGETLDYVSGNYRIFQYESGHRFSTDDLLVAWYGTTWVPRAERILDLGSGIGSVALICAWRLPGARLVTVEAQETSLALAKKSYRYDGLEGRVTAKRGDFRDPGVLENEPPFDLVLGSPPYFPPGTATPAAHPQAVPARIEVMGSVSDYASAARRHLAPGGLFTCVFPCAQNERVKEALRGAALLLVRTRDVVFREGEPPAIGLFAASRQEDLPDELASRTPILEPPLTIRRADGERSAEYAALRLALGFPP